jgi:Uncharacterized protein conserved in bacteria
VSIQNPLVGVLEDIPYSACPIEGVATAGQPPEEAWSGLARAGYRTVIDLRTPAEPRDYDEPASVRAAGLDYVALPVSQPTLRDATFDRFRELMRDTQLRPIFVHCASSNRVGALLLPYFALDEGKPLAEALQLAQRAGLRNPELGSMAIDYSRRHGAQR